MAPKAIRVALSSAYPYLATRRTCNTSVTRQPFYPLSQINYLYNDVGNLGNPQVYKDAILKGPIVVRVRADTSQWQNYSSGVLNDPGCYGNSGKWNHAVVIVGVGYDAVANLDYFLIRNSWGKTWGEAGYIRIAMTASGYGICGQHVQGWNITMKTI